MAFKPNYRQQRSERTRAKELKKQEKLAKREEDAAKRRAEREAAGLAPDPADAARPIEDSDGSPRPTTAGTGESGRE